MRHKTLKIDLAVLSAVVAAIGASYFLPDLMESMKYYILGAVMLVIGIPHGALDHIVTSRVYKLKPSLYDQLKFYVPYLFLIILMGMVWYLSGIAGFLLFACITIYHFGQADLEYLNLPTAINLGLIISRGTMILALIIFFDVSYTLPVIETATKIEASKLSWFYKSGIWIGLLLALQHPVIILFSIILYKDQQEQPWRYAVLDSIAIFFLFTLTDPIIGFSIYFGLWHSMGHILEMKDFFNKIGESLGIWRFYKLALPFTLISIFGLFLLYFLNQAFGTEQQMVALLFILISVLTLPHVLVVQKMFDSKNKFIG